MNGVSGSAAAWVNALEKLTMRSDLTSGTLLPLRILVPRVKLLSKKERFCPSCYRDDESVGRPKYNRLLWSIHCVEACSLHNALLETVPEAPRRKRYTFWLPGLSRIDGASLANHETREANEEQVRSARLVAELLDKIHQCPEPFANGSWTGEFIQHSANTLFDGNIFRLAKHLGVPRTLVVDWRTGQRPSLPMLTIIANRCGCAISDVLLGNNVMLRKMYESPDARTVICRRRQFVKFKTSVALIAELKRLEKLGLTKNLSQACRLLDVNESCLRRLAPDFAARLVQRGREARRREKIEREETRFNDYWQSFQEIYRENRKPTGNRVAARMSQRTGRGINVFEVGKFHARAVRLAKLLSVTRDKNAQEKPLAKIRDSAKPTNSRRKRH
jgi:hypothetical protein